MMTIREHLSRAELEACYKTADDPIAESHFHALWLLSSGYEIEEVAELLSFSSRWLRALIKRYNESGAQALGDQRIHNGTKPTILTPRGAGIKTPTRWVGCCARAATGHAAAPPRALMKSRRLM